MPSNDLSRGLKRVAWALATVTLLALTGAIVARPPGFALTEAALPVVGIVVAATPAVAVLLWRILPLDLMVTVAHELAHAFVAVLVGGAPQHVKVTWEVNGAHAAYLPDTRGRRALVAFAGQQGPGALGTLLAGLVACGRLDLATWVAAGTAAFASLVVLRSAPALIGVSLLCIPLVVSLTGAQLATQVAVVGLSWTLAAGGLGASWRDLRLYSSCSPESDEAIVSRLLGVSVMGVTLAQFLLSALWLVAAVYLTLS